MSSDNQVWMTESGYLERLEADGAPHNPIHLLNSWLNNAATEPDGPSPGPLLAEVI